MLTLGVMFSLPSSEKPKGIMTWQQLIMIMTARLDIGMGGRVAEELINGKGKISASASSDFENASQMARATH